MTVRTGWIPISQIEPMWHLNVRERDEDHIESLQISILEHGFRHEYPVHLFSAKQIPNITTDKPYLLAAGYHRFTAAQTLKPEPLEKVFAEIHTGDEDEFLEFMAMDNRQYDASQPGIAKAFTEKERRRSCKQLLLLPKYMQKTNVALAEEWKVTEGTVRNWRWAVSNQVLGLDDTGLDYDKNGTGLNISEERKERLTKIIQSNARTNGAGEAVRVKKPVKKSKIEERKAVWKAITDSLYHRYSDDRHFMSRHELGTDNVADAVAEFFDLNPDKQFSFYEGPPDAISLARMQNLHNLILNEDAGFINRCQYFKKQALLRYEAREKAVNAAGGMYRLIKKELYPNEDSIYFYDNENQIVLGLMDAAIQERLGYEPHNRALREMSLEDASFATTQINLICKDIRLHIEHTQTPNWVTTCMLQANEDIKEFRHTLEAEFIVRQAALQTEFDKYCEKRPIAPAAFQEAMFVHSRIEKKEQMPDVFDTEPGAIPALTRRLKEHKELFEETIEVLKASDKLKKCWLHDIPTHESLQAALGENILQSISLDMFATTPEGDTLFKNITFIQPSAIIFQTGDYGSLDDIPEPVRVALVKLAIALTDSDDNL